VRAQAPDTRQLIYLLVHAGLLRQDRRHQIAFQHGWLAGFLAGSTPESAPAFHLSGRWGDKAVIGVTGNIAVGKSTALAMLSSLGAHVIDADKIVHLLRMPGAPGYAPLLDLLGPEILLPDGRVDAQRLAAKAFADNALLARLESVFHPLVIAEVGRQGRSSRSGAVIIEAIKLLEGDLRTQVDRVWVVDAPLEQQIERLMQTRGLSRAEAVARIEAQSPQADKLAQADVIIHNDGDRSAMWRQIVSAWSEVLDALWHRGWLKDNLVERFVGAHLAQGGAALPLEDALRALRRLAGPMTAAPVALDRAVDLLNDTEG